LQLSPDEVGLAYWGAAAWAARIALSKDQPEVVADLPSAVRLATLAWQVDPTHGRGALASLMGTLERRDPAATCPRRAATSSRLLPLPKGASRACGSPRPRLWPNRPQLRIGTVVPKNSLYHRQLLELGEAWRAAQGGGAKYVVFTDGSQGGEAELARRMRIGQLQGALLSVVGLREIEPSIAALQKPAAAVPQLGRGGPRAREDAPGDGEEAS
jgi:hypothetical protein